jgi:CRP-like cAMP-binding protein
MPDVGEDRPAERRPLPFGLRLDKWRVVPQQPAVPHEGAFLRVRASTDIAVCAGSQAQPVQLAGETTSCLPVEPGSAAEKEAELGRPTLKSPIRTSTPGSPVVKRTSTPETPAVRKSSLVRTLAMAAKMKGIAGRARSASENAPKIRKERRDTTWVIEEMVKLRDVPGNLLANGFNEMDARVMGLVCTHLRVPEGETFAEAGDACEHVAIVLQGTLAAYHHKTQMESYEAGAQIGAMSLTSENTKYTFTIVAQDEVFLALLPRTKLLAYIQDLEVDRAERIMNYCFTVLLAASLEAEHKCEAYNCARVVQNSFRVHRARREFWSIRQHLQATPANIIKKVWRGHRARKWLW